MITNTRIALNGSGIEPGLKLQCFRMPAGVSEHEVTSVEHIHGDRFVITTDPPLPISIR